MATKYSNRQSVDRRASHSIRAVAVIWFEQATKILKNATKDPGILAQLGSWTRPEDVMRNCPRLIPLLLDIAWQNRSDQAFESTFLGMSGKVVNSKSETLRSCGQSFHDAVISHLRGTLRLGCEARERAWVQTSASRFARNRGLFSRAFNKLGLAKTPSRDALLTDYPHRGKYELLKSNLYDRAQFACLDAFYNMPTRTISILGGKVRGLRSLSAINNINRLDHSALKALCGAADTLADAILNQPGVSRIAFDLEKELGLSAICAGNIEAIAGLAISRVMHDHPEAVQVIIGARERAEAVIRKMYVVMGFDTLRVFKSDEAVWNIVCCPQAIAESIGSLAMDVCEEVSDILSQILDERATRSAIEQLLEELGPAEFCDWASHGGRLDFWKAFVEQISGVSVPKDSESALTREQLESIRRRVKDVVVRFSRHLHASEIRLAA